MAVHTSGSSSRLDGDTKPALLACLLVLSLAGCGEQDEVGLLIDESPQQYEVAVTLTGTVDDGTGTVTQGKIVATDETGTPIASTTLQHSGRYSIAIPANTTLPILLQAYPETGGAERKPLTVAIVEATLTHYNINPRTTAIAERAKALGGYTRKNVLTATAEGAAVPEKNKTTEGFRGDPTRQYGGWH